jgi:hypothetical protein
MALGFRFDPIVEGMMMGLAIGPDHFQTEIGLRPQVLQNLWGGDRVIDGGTTHQEPPQKPPGGDTDVTLSSGDCLAAVIAPFSPALSGFYRLTIDTGGAWCGLLQRGLQLSDLLTQGVHQVLPCAIVSPLRKLLIDGAFGKQVVRQHVPLAARSIEVQDDVDDFTHIHLTRASPRLSRWNQRLQNRPLLIGQVRLIGFARRGSHGELRKNGLKPMTTIY